MGFLDKLKLKDWLGVRNAPTRRAVLYTVDDATGEAVPLTAGQLGAGDPASAREATLAQVRDGITALSALLGSTDGLEALTTQTNSLLTALGGYTDGLEGLLGTLGDNTDGIEGLLSALGVKDDNVLSKLEALRLLLAGTLTVNTGNPDPATGARQTTGNTTLSGILSALQGTLAVNQTVVAPGTVAADIPSGSSTGVSVNAAGLSVVRIVIGASWTAADLSLETSADGGVTWVPLYDAYNVLITYKVGASRAINVPVGDLLRLNRIRVRSGIPGAYVTQTSAASVTLVTTAL